MTKREFYTKISKMENIDSELIEFAAAAIEALDKTNETRREKALEKNAEKEAQREPLREAIMAVMGAEAKTASTLIAESGIEVKPQMIPSLVKPLILNGKVEKAEVKIPGKPKAVGYRLV